MNKFYVVDLETGKKAQYEGKAGAYMGEKDIDFDESILDKIKDETNSILLLEGWSNEQLATYNNLLSAALGKYDSALSDITHAMAKYNFENNGKKPQAHKMAKLGYLIDDIQEKRKKIKECLRYIKVLRDAISFKYDINKLKLELSKAKEEEYRGRTEFYEMALKILQ